MRNRHRASQFPNPFDLELDPERELWVPHRRDRIFVPSSAPSKTIDLPPFNPWTAIVESEESRFRRREAEMAYFLAYLSDCSPSRSRYLGQSRGEFRIPVTEKPPVTWNDVDRAPEPNFRSHLLRNW